MTEDEKSEKVAPLSRAAIQIYLITVFFYTVVYVVLMLLPFHAKDHGATQTEVGLIMGTTMLASTISRPIVGVIIDRHGPGRVFVGAMVVFAASLGLYFAGSLLLFGVARFVQGIVAAAFSTAMEIVTIQLVTAARRGEGLSLYSLATMLPTTFGPAIALAARRALEMRTLFLALLAISVLNVLLGFAVTRTTLALRAAANRSRASEAHGPHSMRCELRSASAIMLLVSVSNGAIFTFVPLYLEERGSPYASLYFLAQTCLLVACRFWLRRRIPSSGAFPKGIVVPMSLLAATGATILACSSSLVPLMLAAICNGIAFALMYPALLTYVSFNVAEGDRGFLLGAFIAAADFGFALGALAMGWLVDLWSFRAMYIACALACVAALLVGLAHAKRSAPQRSPSN